MADLELHLLYMAHTPSSLEAARARYRSIKTEEAQGNIASLSRLSPDIRPVITNHCLSFVDLDLLIIRPFRLTQSKRASSAPVNRQVI